jgi:hypothetical protein
MVESEYTQKLSDAIFNSVELLVEHGHVAPFVAVTRSSELTTVNTPYGIVDVVTDDECPPDTVYVKTWEDYLRSKNN